MTTTLHTEAVTPELLETLREMVARAALSDFFLVGGTSLALRFGHRISVDLDLAVKCRPVKSPRGLPGRACRSFPPRVRDSGR